MHWITKENVIELKGKVMSHLSIVKHKVRFVEHKLMKYAYNFFGWMVEKMRILRN